MTTTSQQSSEKLIKLLEQEQSLMTRFLELTRAQEQMIADENMDELLKNLDARQQIIGQADDLRPVLDKLLAEQAVRPAPAAETQTINNLRRQTGRILQEIKELDVKNQTAVRSRMDFFQTEIRRINNTKKGVSTYMKGSEIFASEFFDECQ